MCSMCCSVNSTETEKLRHKCLTILEIILNNLNEGKL